MANTSSENSGAEKPRIALGRTVYKGIPMFINEVEEIEVMDTREDDVWVCTFSRSGTTLTQEIVYLLESNLDFDTAKSVQLDDRFPIIDVKDDRFPYYRGVKFVEQMNSPRLIKCHLPNFLLPEQLRQGKGRIIYIARNPKDVLTSLFRLMQWGDGLVEEDATWELFSDAFISGTGHNGSWADHVLGFWNNRHNQNMLFLTFENLVGDTPATVRQTAKFLNKDVSDEDVKRICEHCHIDNMRKNDKVNMSYWRDIKKVFDDADGGFINQGKVGTWKQLLTPDVASRIDEHLYSKVKEAGLSLD